MIMFPLMFQELKNNILVCLNQIQSRVLCAPKIMKYLCDDRFSKYLSKEQTSNEKQNLCEKFGEDACTKFKNKTGIVLEKNQIDILKDSWKADDPSHITAFKKTIVMCFLLMNHVKLISMFPRWMILLMLCW